MKELLKGNKWNFPSKAKTFVGSTGIYSEQNTGDLKRILKSVQEKGSMAEWPREGDH